MFRSMIRGLGIAVLLGPAMIAMAQAEVFHDEGGIRFEGRMTKVAVGFAECETLGQRHHVDLWRIDYVIRNDSGRPLGQFGADSWVRAEKRRCIRFTRRSGFPEFRLIVPAFFEHHEMIRNAEGLAAGQEAATRSYLLSFSGDVPAFEGYEFAAESVYEAARAPDPEATQASAEQGGGSTQRASAPAGQLSPGTMAERYLRKAEQAVQDGEVTIARLAMERLKELQAAHVLEPAPEDHYRHAQAWAAAGEPRRAVEAAVLYLQSGGRDAEHHMEALDLIKREGSPEPVPGAATAAAGRPRDLPIQNSDWRGPTQDRGADNEPISDSDQAHATAAVITGAAQDTAPRAGDSGAYALCAFTAEFNPENLHSGYDTEKRGVAWVDRVDFRPGQPIPPMRDLGKAFADGTRARSWAAWNPLWQNEAVNCEINRNPAPGQGRRNEADWKASFRAHGWDTRGIGGIYWWDSEAGRPRDLLIQNSDWRGPTQYHGADDESISDSDQANGTIGRAPPGRK